MENFNLNRVIERYSLDSSELAKGMFPDAKHAGLALSRVLKNELPIDTEQLSWLAAYIGVPVSELFEVGCNWKAAQEQGCMVFHKGEYTVRLNYEGAFCVVCKNGEIIDRVVQSPHAMSVSEFINYIDCLILKK